MNELRKPPSSDQTDRQRGRCPLCGSIHVTHHVLGMPTAEAFRAAPEWVDFGCTGPLKNRSCENCGFEWNIKAPQYDVISRVEHLFELIGVFTLDELGREISEYYDLDVYFDVEGDYALVPIINSVGVTMPYPFTIDEFRDDLTFLNDQQVEWLEAADDERTDD